MRGRTPGHLELQGDQLGGRGDSTLARGAPVLRCGHFQVAGIERLGFSHASPSLLISSFHENMILIPAITRLFLA
jgi:hypothetical protein